MSLQATGWRLHNARLVIALADEGGARKTHLRLGPEAARGVPTHEQCLVTEPAQFLAFLVTQDANADCVHGNLLVDGASSGSRFAFPVLLILILQLPLRLLILLRLLRIILLLVLTRWTSTLTTPRSRGRRRKCAFRVACR